MPEIDFSGLAAQATEMANAAVSNTSAPSGASTDSVPVQTPTTPDAVSGQQPITQPVVDGTVATPTTLQTFDVDFGNGRVEKLTQAQIADRLREAERSGLRQSDYTKKTQELAQQRQEALNVYNQLKAAEQDLAWARQLKSNPQLAQQWAAQELVKQQPIDPNAPMTVQHAQQMGQIIQQRFQEMEQGYQTKLQQQEQLLQQRVQDQLVTAAHAEQINATLAAAYKEFPILNELKNVIPQLEDNIRWQAGQLVAGNEAATINDAIAAIKQITKQMADAQDAVIKSRNVQQEQARQTLVKQGIEPPGGGAPQPAAPKFTNEKGKIDWKALRSAAAGIAAGN